MPTLLVYLFIFIAAAAWHLYCEYKGWIFYIGLTCFALGVACAVAAGVLEEHRGVAFVLVSAFVGYIVGSLSTTAFLLIVFAPYHAFMWVKKRITDPTLIH